MAAFPFKCHQCEHINPNPAQACPNCGQTLEMSLILSTDHSKLSKHGLYVHSGSIEIAPLLDTSVMPPNTSFFDPSVDIVHDFKYVAASGSPIMPRVESPHRHASLIWIFGHTTGVGIFNGAPTYFNGVRLVRPDSPYHIHLFPDNYRPRVDNVLNCRVCDRLYPVIDLPEKCDCGHRFGD